MLQWNVAAAAMLCSGPHTSHDMHPSKVRNTNGDIVIVVVVVIQPRMLQTLFCSCPPRWIKVQHRNEKVSQLIGTAIVPLIFLNQHLDKAPRFQLCNVTQLACRQNKKKTQRALHVSTVTFSAIHCEYGAEMPM